MKADYNTKQRAIILDFLKENSDHFTAKEVATHLRELGFRIGIATVYRTLYHLAEQGILRKFVIDPRSGACFQYVEGAECIEHFHLKCIKCGTLVHMDCGFLKEMESHILNDHGFTVSSGKTVIYGTCAKCNGKGDSNEDSGTCCSHNH